MDLVIYYADNKEIVSIVQDMPDEPKYLIADGFVATCLGHNDYAIENRDGIAYFVNLNEKILYLDEYRGRYKE